MSDVASLPPVPPRKPNTLLWRILLLPSILILGAAIGLYELLPARDAFLRGETTGSYLLFASYSSYSPKFWMGGIASAVFAIGFLLALVRTVARGEWVYWQRLLGLLALTAGGVLLLLTGLPEFGVASRDAGAVSFNGRSYHLFAQAIPAAPGTDLRFLIFECDPAGVTCQRVHRDDKEYAAGDRVPPLELLRIDVDGIFVVVRSDSPVILTQYRPQ